VGVMVGYCDEPSAPRLVYCLVDPSLGPDTPGRRR